jgi:hypothetical protein
LEAFGFAWKSIYRGGTKSMAQYQEFVQRVNVEVGVEAIMAETQTIE